MFEYSHQKCIFGIELARSESTISWQLKMALLLRKKMTMCPCDMPYPTFILCLRQSILSAQAYCIQKFHPQFSKIAQYLEIPILMLKRKEKNASMPI